MEVTPAINPATKYKNFSLSFLVTLLSRHITALKTKVKVERNRAKSRDFLLARIYNSIVGLVNSFLMENMKSVPVLTRYPSINLLID